jgi:biopolymer transport protein ExbB/TolQ
MLARGTEIAHAVVRACGFVLLAVGLWIALAVISEAWSLYQEPQKVERFAQAIEQGSHLDHALSSTSSGRTSAIEENAPPTELSTGTPATTNNPEGAGFRLSYFVAWIVIILLLMLIGRLAIAAVKTGGELVLYERNRKWEQTTISQPKTS